MRCWQCWWSVPKSRTPAWLPHLLPLLLLKSYTINVGIFLGLWLSQSYFALQKFKIWMPNYCLYLANSRTFQLRKPLWQTISEKWNHICLICQHIIARPITNCELRVRWQGGQSTVCIYESEPESICSQRGSVLQVYAQAPASDPHGNQSHSGQPETHDVILREHGLPTLGEKVYKTQSQHHSITGVNCIYSCTAVAD